jgi:hypothetical protein
MQFMIPHITKNMHQESNLAATHTEEGTALSGENEEGTQLNEAPGSITPSESLTVIQASCRQRNQDDCRQLLLGKRCRLTAFDPVDTRFKYYMKQQTQTQMQNFCTAYSQT